MWGRLWYEAVDAWITVRLLEWDAGCDGLIFCRRRITGTVGVGGTATECVLVGKHLQ